MLCFIARWRIDRALDAGRLPAGGVEAHLGECEGCRRFHDSRARVAAALAREADRARAEGPPSLAEETVAAVRSASGPSVMHRRPRRLVPAIAAACVCLVAAVGLATRSRRAQERQKARQAARELIELKGILFASVSFGEERRGAPASPLRRAAGVPFAAELDNIRADTFAAGSFLLDCIPRAVVVEQRKRTRPPQVGPRAAPRPQD